MIKISKNNSNSVRQSTSTIIYEYQMDEISMSGAVAEINGRYPETGFAVNEVSKELVYVVKGSGKLVKPNKETEFSDGDVLFIDKNEPFAWLGSFTIFMVTAPKFNPNQHKIILTPSSSL